MAGVPLQRAPITPTQLPGWAEIWETVRSRLQRELGQGVFETWIAPLSFTGAEDGHVVLSAPRKFVRDYVAQHYVPRLEAALTANFSEFASIEITVDETAEARTAPKVQTNVRAVPAPVPALGGSGGGTTGLWDREPDPQQTFGTFIAGTTNEFALGAARRVAEGDGDIGLLFIHGGFGYGKTHLLNAIAHHCSAARRGRALLLRAEDFMRKFLGALRDRDTLAFKEELRGADILLIDDLQHICGKQATVSEFLHTLNAFTDARRRLVIAADRPPALLEGLPEDVSSRLKGALVIQMQKPDTSTRLAILRARAQELEKRRPRAALPDAILEHVAREVDGPPRELLGVFNKLATYADLTGQPVTMEFVEEALEARGATPERRVTIEEIQKKTAEFYKLELKDLQSQCRARRIARPRQVAMFLARQLTSRSLPDIGRRFGHKDHTTVLHACRRVAELCQNDPVFQQEVDFLRKVLGRPQRL